MEQDMEPSGFELEEPLKKLAADVWCSFVVFTPKRAL